MRPFAPPRVVDAFLLFAVGLFCTAVGIVAAEVAARAEEVSGTHDLLVVHDADWITAIPADSHALVSPKAIEDFLAALDHTIPDWPALYGAGHHDPAFDDRLFQFNRVRDEQRQGRKELSRRITFCWSGTLDPYDPARDGFPVAVGPEFTKTTWGIVRFKPEDLPSNLTAMSPPSLRDRLMDRMKNGHSVEVKVALTGRLISEESVIYDFSHEEEGQGLIMPVVRVEQVQYLLVDRP